MVKSHLLYRLSYRTTSPVAEILPPGETFILHIEKRVGKPGSNFARFFLTRCFKAVCSYDLNQPSIVESGSIIVWSRSGPVEIKPISTPTASDKKRT